MFSSKKETGKDDCCCGGHSMQEVHEEACCCGGNEFHEHHKDECGCSEQKEDRSSRFIFLGACGRESHETFKNVKQAVKELGFADEVVPIGDAAKVAKYGVDQTPALVVDNQVLSVGRVLTVEDVKIIFQKKEIDDKLKQLGIKGPGYIRNMMDNDMKGVEICFLE